MLSLAFSMSNLMKNEDVLIRRINEFLDIIGDYKSGRGRRGMDIVSKLSIV